MTATRSRRQSQAESAATWRCFSCGCENPLDAEQCHACADERGATPRRKPRTSSVERNLAHVASAQRHLNGEAPRADAAPAEIPETQAQAAAKEAAADRVPVPLIQIEPLLATYSADRIRQGKIRKPVQIDGRLWVMIGGVSTGADGYSEIEFIEAVRAADFGGQTITPRDLDSRSTDAILESGMFYDGVQVSCGRELYVLRGPERTTPGHGFGRVRPKTMGKQRKRRQPAPTAPGIEEIVLQFRAESFCRATIELQEQQPGVWAERTTWATNCWRKQDKPGHEHGMTEMLSPHKHPPSSTREEALRFALIELRQRIVGISEKILNARGRKARPLALEDIDRETARLLGEETHASDRETTDPDDPLIGQIEGPGIGAGDVEMFALPTGGILLIETADVEVKLIDWRDDNPRRDFSDEYLDQLATSLREQGQQNPIVLRMTPAGRFEGWQGQCRFRAVTEILNRQTIRARVYPTMTPDWLLIRGRADENLQRQDLNPIERAESLRQKLLSFGWQPDEAGGPSLRSLAPKLGMSQGELSNHLRLFTLPADWQQRVMTGDITTSQARVLCAWSDRPAVLDAVSKRFKNSRPADRTTRDFEREVEDVVKTLSRPLEHNAYFYIQRKAGYRSGRVALTAKDVEDNAARLDIITLGTERRACNVELWDSLQSKREQQARDRVAGQSKSTGEKRERTPAEERQLKEQQRRQLQKRVFRYKINWLQQRAAARLAQAEGEMGLKLLLYFAAAAEHSLTKSLMAAIRDAGGKTSGDSGAPRVWKSLSSIPVDDPSCKMTIVTREVLSVWLAQDAFAPRPAVRATDVPAIAGELGVDIDKQWRVDDAFLELFNKAQLIDLARDWKLHLASNLVSESCKRGELIAHIVAQDQLRRLRVPTILAKAKG